MVYWADFITIFVNLGERAQKALAILSDPEDFEECGAMCGLFVVSSGT